MFSMRKLSLVLFVLFLIPITTVCSVATQDPEDAKYPNIIVILADDMGMGDIGAYNPESKIPTPNLDRLSTEGISLSDSHSPSAVCTPTRYALLTGRYSWRTRLRSGVLWGYSPSLIEPGRTTIASLLKKEGYSTAGIGKWHLGLGQAEETDYSQVLDPNPTTFGFDYFWGIPASLDMQPYLYFENDRAVVEPTDHIDESLHRRQNGGGMWRAGPVAPGFIHEDVLPAITNKAVEFIRDSVQQPDRPFFLYWALTAPHTPWLPTKSFQGKSQAGYYGDFCVQVDYSVGKVLAELDTLGLTNDTLVIFTSDNGSHWPVSDIERFNHKANLEYRGQKADIWEGGHRVPFIARWPGKIDPGSKSNQTSCHTDLLATIAAIVGRELEPQEGEDSFNLLPVFLDPKGSTTEREATVHHSFRGVFAIRHGDWKLILGRGSGGFTDPHTIEPADGEPVGQLYNLKDDPSETNNLFLDNPEVVKKLTALLEQYKEQGHSR